MRHLVSAGVPGCVVLTVHWRKGGSLATGAGSQLQAVMAVGYLVRLGCWGHSHSIEHRSSERLETSAY